MADVKFTPVGKNKTKHLKYLLNIIFFKYTFLNIMLNSYFLLFCYKYFVHYKLSISIILLQYQNILRLGCASSGKHPKTGSWPLENALLDSCSILKKAKID